MELAKQIVPVIVTVATIFWLYYDGGWEPLIASLGSVAIVAGIGIDREIRHRRLRNEHLQQEIEALRQIKAVTDNIPPNLGQAELLERLRSDANFRDSLRHRLDRLFGLRRELVPYIDAEFVDLIDKQFQPLFTFGIGTYGLREEKLEEFAHVAVQLRLCALSVERRLTQKYKRSLD